MDKKNFKACIVFIFVLLFLLSAFLVAGCGSKNGESKETGGTSEVIGRENVERVCQANLRTIDAAVQTYCAQNGSYPRNINELVPTFLRSVPVEPSGGTYSLEGNPPKAVCSKGHSYK